MGVLEKSHSRCSESAGSRFGALAGFVASCVFKVSCFRASKTCDVRNLHIPIVELTFSVFRNRNYVTSGALGCLQWPPSGSRSSSRGPLGSPGTRPHPPSGVFLIPPGSLVGLISIQILTPNPYAASKPSPLHAEPRFPNPVPRKLNSKTLNLDPRILSPVP